MKKIGIIPDSFKGSMSSEVVASTIERVAKEVFSCETSAMPIADGGEGSTKVILAKTGGKLVSVKVLSPERKEIEAYFGVMTDGTCVIEIAESSGLAKQTSFEAMEATTYGFGQLILAALEQGYREFLLCLGGSATTDCACGMAAALGVSFLDENGNSFIPVGGTLKDVVQIDLSSLDARIKESQFKVMSDVENPLFGKDGAAYVYAPQKGASAEEVKLLDDGLKNIAKCIFEAMGISCDTVTGAGAAGGAGYGCVAFLNAEIVSGIEAMLDIYQFDENMQDADLIITGEGKLDEQSLMGKVLCGVKKHAGDIPILSVCGSCTLPKETLLANGVTALEIGRGLSTKESMERGEELLEKALREYFCAM